MDAIEICVNNNFSNDELPVFLVKLGVVYLYKGIFDKAEFWCEHGGKFAGMLANESAMTESKLCLQKLDELKSKKKVNK